MKAFPKCHLGAFLSLISHLPFPKLSSTIIILTILLMNVMSQCLDPLPSTILSLSDSWEHPLHLFFWMLCQKQTQYIQEWHWRHKMDPGINHPRRNSPQLWKTKKLMDGVKCLNTMVDTWEAQWNQRVALRALNKDYEDNSEDTNPKRKHLKPKAQLLMTILGIQKVLRSY